MSAPGATRESHIMNLMNVFLYLRIIYLLRFVISEFSLYFMNKRSKFSH